jgi:3'(2'), 5'-bisphosphate nucleotidase
LVRLPERILHYIHFLLLLPQANNNYNTLNQVNTNLQLAIRAAILGGREIMQVYALPAAQHELEYKADASPLTLADRRSHEAIMSVLAPTAIPVLSEEGAHLPYEERRAWTSLWVVDPLDGTKEFVKRNGEFTVNIALVEDTVPVLGVMFEPNTNTLYYGEVGVGAFRVKVDENGDFAEAPVALPLAKEFEPSEYVVVVSRSHLSPETEEYIDILREDFEKVTMVQAGSALKIARVAEGLAMEYPRFGPTMEWDTAAGDAIVRAAGGCMVRAEDDLPLVYNKADLHNPWFVVKSKLI